MPELLSESPDQGRRVRLLVSIRDADEADAAVAGGAGVIDVKEPTRGPLGAADVDVVERVVSRVAGRRPVTMAGGDLAEAVSYDIDRLPSGVAMLKIGLAGARGRTGWRSSLAGYRARLAPGVDLTPVAYADAEQADAPEPEAVFEAAAQLGFPWAMIDTFDKNAGPLFAHLGPDRLGQLIGSAREGGVRVALAGRLDREGVQLAANLGAELVGVRGAVCLQGRTGPVERGRVAAVVSVLEAVKKAE